MELELITTKKWLNTRTGRSGGNTHGYNTAAESTKRALLFAGVNIKEGADMCVHYTSAPFFEPVEGRVNILFTMWEAETLPPDMVEHLSPAKYIIVPSKNSKDVIKRAELPATIYVCHQAVDTGFYRFKQRVVPEDRPVRYLWLGAPNIRKGFDIAVKAFHHAFHGTGANVELYIKSSFFKREGEITVLDLHKATIDTRNLSREGVRDLYWKAHVFFFPSRGEGAGLTPLEAMSTGLPVIAPPYTGMRDYMLPAFSYPVNYKLTDVHYGLDTKLCEADMDDLVKKLKYTYGNLGEAFQKGKKASEFVGSNFDHKTMGDRMIEILRKIATKEGIRGW